MGSVHQGPVNNRDNEREVARAELVRALGRVVKTELGEEACFAERETAALAACNEATRCYCEQALQQLSDSYDDELLINGKPYKRSHEPGLGIYHSLMGPLPVWRATYRREGERHGPTVVPLELEAGLIERATPALGYSIALDYGHRTSREYVESMGAAHRHVPSRSTVERIGKAIGQAAKVAAPRIESSLRRSEKVPEEAVAVSIGLDRTSVPYEEAREEGAPPKTKRKKRTKPYQRSAPPPVDVNYRMDYVGTVSLVDKDGDKLVSRKYFATHEDGPEGIVKRMTCDIGSALKQRPELPVGIVQDGAPEMWNLVGSALKEELGIENPKGGIDRYHLFERLGDVMKVLEKDEEKRAPLLREWDKALDQDDATIERIEQTINDRVWGYCGTALETLLDTLTYIENNKDRMRYVTLREAGLPVGSGITEGACKSLVGVRAKRSGQRWHNEGLSSVMELRSIHQSERLPRFWRHLHRRYTARVELIEDRVA